MKINVTKKHLRNGKRSQRNLPICLAVRDAGFAGALTDGYWLEVLSMHGKPWTLGILPRNAKRQMLRWLKNEPVKPFGFLLQGFVNVLTPKLRKRRVTKREARG